jgi:hypothetical protein
MCSGMGAAIADVIAILRCTSFAVGLPSVIAYSCFETRSIMDAFDRTVAPLIDRTITDPARNREASRALQGTSLKVSLALSGYARMAGVPFDADLAVLGSSFTRVYDDLFDNFETEKLDDRLSALFRGGSFRPASGAESLLLALYRAIDTKLARPNSDPIFRMLSEMHEFQCMSRWQRDPAISAAEVREITRGKGGIGATILFALFRPGMTTDEQAVLHDFGDILQLLDDLNDAAVDRTTGVVTEVTLGTCTLGDLAARMRLLRRRLAVQYPGSGRRRVIGMLLFMLIGAAIRQRTDARRGVEPPPTGTPVRPRLLFYTRVENLQPERVELPAVD